MIATIVLQCGLLIAAVDQTRRALSWSATIGRADPLLVAWLKQYAEPNRGEVFHRWLALTGGSLVGECVVFGLGLSLGDGTKGDPVADWRAGVRSRQYVLQRLTRMTSVFTLLAIVLELSWGLAGGSGIEALQAGLPQRLAFRNVLISLALGFVTLGVSVWASRVLQNRARKTNQVLRQIPEAIGSQFSSLELT